MKASIERVVREFVIRVDGLRFSVKARVSEIMNGEDAGMFYWSISHHYSPTKNGQAYFPGHLSAATSDDAETLLMAYAQGFTAFDVVPNAHY